MSFSTVPLETAAMKSFRAVFENIEIGGCLFSFITYENLAQIDLPKVNECRFKYLYESNQSFAIHTKIYRT